MITKGVVNEIEIFISNYFLDFNAGYSLEASSGTNIVVFRRNLDFDYIDYLVYTAINSSDGNGASSSLSIGGISKYSDNAINDGERISQEIDCTAITGIQEVNVLYGDNDAISGHLENISIYRRNEAA